MIDPALIADLARRWSLRVGEAYADGLGDPVLRVTAWGRPAVLKVTTPDEHFRAQLAALLAADGRSYARVLASDVGAGAVLLERLGEGLHESGLPAAEQTRILAATLRLAWQLPLDTAPPPAPGQDKASGLLRILDTMATAQDAVYQPAIEIARAHARWLRNSRDPEQDVLCHGDPHPANALRAERSPTGYLFVDPDGFRGEREYDLGVILRDFKADVLDISARQGDAAARRWLSDLASALAEETGADATRVWRWAFVERVTTGLYVRAFGQSEEARLFLDSALVLSRG